MIWTATTAQAQLYIDVYPSQDDPTKTLWRFAGGAAEPFHSSSIRNSGNYHARDSWTGDTITYGGTNIYFNNKPTNQVFSLSPLFSSANHPKDIESITTRFPGSRGIFDTNTIWFRNFDTNSPTMESSSSGSLVSTNKTIGGIFMNDAAQDEIGIRHTGGSNLWYTNGQTSLWFGSGILNKPISDFNTTSYGGNFYSSQDIANRPFFVEIGSQI